MKISFGNGVLPFMRFRKIAVVFSAIVLLAGLASLFTKGLNVGLDFTGGNNIYVSYQTAADLTDIRSRLEQAGLKGAVVNIFGSSKEVSIRLPTQDHVENEEIVGVVLDTLRQGGVEVAFGDSDFVGSIVGEELTNDGGMAVLVALIAILIYVSLRFEWKFAVGSVAALAHDVLFTLGFFSIMQLDFDLNILAAVLAVIGYSLNDTIVVFDRIRENFLKSRKEKPIDIIDQSLTQTFSRTLITSITTLLVVLALFFWGGPVIHGFASALIVGVLIGTYSSIYVASTVALKLGVCKEDLIPPVIDKEGADQEPLV